MTMTSLVTKTKSNKVIKATFPLAVYTPKGKRISISDNWYRRAHFHESNKIKKHYTEDLAAPQLKNHSPMVGVVFSLYVLYTPDKRRRDLDNFTNTHKKFFHDAMTQYGIIEDDDTTRSPFQISLFGGVDKKNPRVDIYICQNFKTIGQLTRNNICLPDPQLSIAQK